MACRLSTQLHRHPSNRQLLQMPHVTYSSDTPNCGMRSLIPYVHHENVVRWDDFFFLIKKAIHHCTKQKAICVVMLLAGLGSLVLVCHLFLNITQSSGSQYFLYKARQLPQSPHKLAVRNKWKVLLMGILWWGNILGMWRGLRQPEGLPGKRFSTFPWKNTWNKGFSHSFLTYEYSKS